MSADPATSTSTPTPTPVPTAGRTPLYQAIRAARYSRQALIAEIQARTQR